MKKSVCYLVFILVLLSEASAQDISKDSISIRHFGSIEYGTVSYNYSSIEDENGIIYVANQNGVLEYDGSEWKLIRLTEHSSAHSLRVSPNGKIYVGGYNEFGYLERNESGQFEYYSLRNLLDPEVQMNEIWQIIFFENQVYFQSYEHIVRFDGEVIHVLPINNAYLLPINGQLYFSTYNEGMVRVNEDSVHYIRGLLDLDNDAAFKILPGLKGKQLVLTETSGVFVLDSTVFSFEKWDVEANLALIRHGLYGGMVWNDSTYLFATIDNGIIWVNSEGKSLREIDQSDGLSDNYMRELLRDSRGNLWLPNDGINYLSWPNNQSSKNFNTIVRYVEISDSTIYVNTNNGQIFPDAQSNSFVFHFATPGFNRSELEYSYYLEGFDDDWSTWKDDIKKEYTNLENRAYIFHVKARLLNGTISSPALINFNIPSLWYQSFWFYFFGILVLGVSYG
jgi:ligand-binding sensor domain-containing protein